MSELLKESQVNYRKIAEVEAAVRSVKASLDGMAERSLTVKMIAKLGQGLLHNKPEDVRLPLSTLIR